MNIFEYKHVLIGRLFVSDMPETCVQCKRCQVVAFHIQFNCWASIFWLSIRIKWALWWLALEIESQLILIAMDPQNRPLYKTLFHCHYCRYTWAVMQFNTPATYHICASCRRSCYVMEVKLGHFEKNCYFTYHFPAHIKLSLFSTAREIIMLINAINRPIIDCDWRPFHGHTYACRTTKNAVERANTFKAKKMHIIVEKLICSRNETMNKCEK